MYRYFREQGSPGIGGIGDAGEAWVFIKAPQEKEMVDYGLHPVFVDKKTGEMRYMNWYNNHDWELHDTAKIVEVPEEYRPNYQ